MSQNGSDYPFTRQAADQVRETGYSIEALLERRGFLPVRKRALERVLGAVGGAIPDQAVHPVAELLSYPLARLMVSCLDDDFLTRRYALAEAKLAGRRMKKEDTADLIPLAQDLDIHPVRQRGLFELHFAEYLKAAHRMRSPKWKLVNRGLRRGRVTVTQDELARLLEERARERVMRGLPLSVPEDICRQLADYTREIGTELVAIKADRFPDLGEVAEEAFPPCIRTFLSQVTEGVNLAHTARFALTSFLINVGMSVDDVVALFNTSPDFDEEKTRYQVDHISGKGGTKYTPPSCATMATYGNCPGEDDLCRRVSHPLSYYRKQARTKLKKS